MKTVLKALAPIVLFLITALIIPVVFQFVYSEEEARITVFIGSVSRQEVIRESSGEEALYFVVVTPSPDIPPTYSYRLQPIPKELIGTTINRVELTSSLRIGVQFEQYTVDGVRIPVGQMKQLGTVRFNLDTMQPELVPQHYIIP